MSADMLVKLYDKRVKPDTELESLLSASGIRIKRGLSANRSLIRAFLTDRFSNQWADEVDSALLKGCCWIAVKDKQVVGVAAYDGLFPDFFGPIGVAEELRGLGIGKALLLRSLDAMKAKGYRYAIIGWTGPQAFYENVCGATIIENSIPGSYADLVQVEWTDDNTAL